jgi:hypothetical protein
MGLVDDCRLIGLCDDPASAEALTPAILDPSKFEIAQGGVIVGTFPA